MSSEKNLPNYGDRLAAAAESRHRAFQQLFNSELHNLTSLMGPIDGPQWPSDSSWLALRNNGISCIVSDGLSDPWVETDKPGTGLGLEVFIQSPDVVIEESAPLFSIADTWLFPMTAEVSHTLASYPRLCARLLLGEPLSIRFNIEHIKDGRGLVGAMLHIPDELRPGITLDAGRVSMVAATLLTVDELRWLAGKGEGGRRQLLKSLYDHGIGYQSLVGRASVV